MAIKQQSTEVVEEKQNDLQHFIIILERLLENPEQIQEGVHLTQICEMIVATLGKIPEPRDAQSIKSTNAEDIPRIHKFFSVLIESRADYRFEVIIGPCLKALYRLLTSPEREPSQLASTVLQIVDDKQIRPAVLWILSQSENTSEECIKRGFKRLCVWLRGLNCCSLHLWIIEILEVLREQGRYDILLELASENIEQLFLTLIIPAIRNRAKPIVFLILSSIRNTPKVFHAIVPRIPKVLHRIRDDPDASSMFQDLLALMDHLIQLFPSHNDMYKEIANLIKSHHHTTSMDIQKLLQGPPWHEEILRQQNLLSTVTFQSKNVRVGLQNLGNTCYLNSVIQALLMTKQFTREILSSQIETDFFHKIQLLIALLVHSERPELDPKGFLPAIRPPDFLPGYQQDSSEFLTYLLDKLHEHEKKIITGDDSGLGANAQEEEKDIVIELKQPVPAAENWDDEEILDTTGLKKFATLEDLTTDTSNLTNGSENESDSLNFIKTQNKIIDNTTQLNTHTLIQKVFGGKVSTTYQCFVCQSKSINIDSFRDLQLAFPEQDSNVAKSTDSYSVQSLLEYYCSSEKLEGDNQYFCDQCKSLCDGQRSIHIIEPPKNLILTLKHFRYEKRYHTRQKLLHNVSHDESITLEIRSNVESNKVYTVKYALYAAIVHCGMSMDSGHYYTFGASDKTDLWYKFNDSFVSTTSIGELNRMAPPNTPYILFYKMTSSTSAESSSSTQTSSNANLTLNLSPARKMSLPVEDQEGTISKKQCLIERFDYDDEASKLPDFCELPLRIQEMIRKDNIDFQTLQRQLMNNKDRSRIFQFKSDKPDSDDEQPPNSCGGNGLNYVNKYIY